MDDTDRELSRTLHDHQSYQDEYLITEVFPKREFHIIGGASGAGKTRWALDLLLDWEQGKPVLDGKISNPVPWAYVATDRGIASIKRTFRQMGIPWGTINVIPARGQDNKTFRELMQIAAKMKVEMLFIEMIGKFVDPPARDFQVEDFLNRVCAYTQPSAEFPNGLTIIGTKEEPKQGPRDKYANPRQRISGTAAWGHYSETIIFLDAVNAGDPTNPERTLYVCPREKSLKFDLKFSTNGHLLLHKKDVKTTHHPSGSR